MSNTPTSGSGERVWLFGAAVVAILVVVIGWFFFISPQRDETTGIEGQTADAQTQNIALQGRLNALANETKNKARYAASLAEARRALPRSSDLSTFVRDVQAVAAKTSTRITSLAVEDTNGFVIPNVGGTQPSPAATSSPAPDATPSPGATPAASAPAGATGAAGSGLLGIGISASVTGRSADLTRFLQQLQNSQPRAVLIVEATRNATQGSSAVLQLAMGVFAAPPGASAATTSASPSPGG